MPLNPKLLKVDETFFDDTVSVKEKRDLPKQVKRRLKMSSVKQEFTRTEINEVIKQVNQDIIEDIQILSQPNQDEIEVLFLFKRFDNNN